jgi:hypothetical protein
MNLDDEESPRFFAEFTLSEILPLHSVQGQNDKRD